MIGIWVRLSSGWPWCCEIAPTVAAALARARQMRQCARSLSRGSLPLFPRTRIWLGPPPTIGLKPSRARFRRGSK